jgi:urea carboxylase
MSRLQAGDRFILAEYGPMSLDVLIRCRLELLTRRLHDESPDSAIISLRAGARSLTVEFDPSRTSQQTIIELLQKTDDAIPDVTSVTIPARKIRLPAVFDEATLQESNERCVLTETFVHYSVMAESIPLLRYMETIRDKASYLPDTLEFMARANGLESRRAAAEALIGEHLVVSVGFFCGTPIALPLDPRKRTFFWLANSIVV